MFSTLHRHLVPTIRAVGLAALCILAGCSPAYDWRDVRLDDIGMKALLPCKPERGERAVELAGESTPVHMVGCDAAGANFAIAYVRVRDGARAIAVQSHWREATLRNIGAADGGQPFAPLAAKAAPVAGADVDPAPVLLSLQGVRPGGTAERPGTAVFGHAAWFGRTIGGTRYLVQAVVYADQPGLEAAETFLTGIRPQ